jgi:hypothetical protein
MMAYPLADMLLMQKAIEPILLWMTFLGVGYYWGLYTALKMAITGKYGKMHITIETKKEKRN